MPAVAQAAPVAGWAAAEAATAAGAVTEAVAAAEGWVAAELLQYQESCKECRQRVCTRQGPYPDRAGMDRTSDSAATYSGRTK